MQALPPLQYCKLLPYLHQAFFVNEKPNHLQTQTLLATNTASSEA